MEQVTLHAKNRDLLGKKVKALRVTGFIPAVLYGPNFNSLSLALDQSEFLKVTQKAGEATIIDLDVEKGEPHKTLIRNIQKDPVSDEIIHVDLYKLNMNKEIQTEIPLEFTGTSAAVEELEGNFITNKDAIKVECLPGKLVDKLVIDISVLKTFEDLIRIKDLNIPEGIEVLEDAEDIIAQVTAPLSEEELEKMESEEAAETEKAQIETMESEAEKEKAEKEAEAGAEEGGETPATPEKTEEKNE